MNFINKKDIENNIVKKNKHNYKLLKYLNLNPNIKIDSILFDIEKNDIAFKKKYNKKQINNILYYLCSELFLTDNIYVNKLYYFKYIVRDKHKIFKYLIEYILENRELKRNQQYYDYIYYMIKFYNFNELKVILIKLINSLSMNLSQYTEQINLTDNSNTNSFKSFDNYNTQKIMSMYDRNKIMKIIKKIIKKDIEYNFSFKLLLTLCNSITNIRSYKKIIKLLIEKLNINDEDKKKLIKKIKKSDIEYDNFSYPEITELLNLVK